MKEGKFYESEYLRKAIHVLRIAETVNFGKVVVFESTHGMIEHDTCEYMDNIDWYEIERKDFIEYEDD